MADETAEQVADRLSRAEEHYTSQSALRSSPVARPSSAFVPLSELAERTGRAAFSAAERAATRRFPVRWPRAYLDLADPTDPSDPILRMGLPDALELADDPRDMPDPVGEQSLLETPFLIHKYSDRALLLVTARCHFYCRFCFRRSFPAGSHREPTPAELDNAFERLGELAQVREVILSGGDPLVLPDDALRQLTRRLAAIPHIERVRVHSRAPVVQPERITDELAEALGAGPPCRMVSHFNHPHELTAKTDRVVATFKATSIPLLNQSVLLAGVNDDAATLAQLFAALAHKGIENYYLHHTDRARGTAHFWVSIASGLRLYQQVRELRPGVRLPRYVIDLPDGSGKVDVEALKSLGDGRYGFHHPDGRLSLVNDSPA